MRPTLSHFLFALAALLLVSSSIVNTATGAGVTDERATRLGRLLEQWPKTEIMPLIHTADTIPQMEAALAEHRQQEVGDAMMMETRTEAAVESETELDEADQVANEIRAEMEAEEEANAKAKSAAAGPAPAEEAPTLLVEVSSQSSTQSDAESESESEADVEVENELDSEAGSVVVAEGEADHEQEADPIVTQQDEVHQVIQDFGLVEQAAQTESESDADAKTEAETEAETVAETEAEVEAETDAEVEAEADSSVEDSAGIEEAKNILKVVSEADAAEHPALAEVAAQTESTAQTETETEAESETDSESESEAESAAEAADIEEAKSILGAVSEEAAEDYPALAEVSVAAETEVEAEAETETEADADSETESEAADAADVANAKEILNAVSEESGEDYPALAETASTITVAAASGAPTPATATVVAASSPVSWSDHPVNIEARSQNEISPVMIPASHVVVNKASAKKLAAAIQSQEEVSTDPSLIALTSSIKKSGCGTGLTSTMVHSPRMASSCTAHDTCYAACGKKQAECDLAFKNDMLKYCNERFSAATAKAKAGFKICTGQANLYYLAVRRLGGAPFAAAQKQSNCDDN